MVSLRKSPLFTTSLKFGFAGGSGVLLYTTFLTRTGLIWQDEAGAWLGYIAIVIMPLCTYFAIREYGRKYLKEDLRLRDSLITGLLVSLFAAAIYSGMKWVEHRVFTDVYQEKLIKETASELKAAGQNEAQINMRLKEIEDHYRSWKPVRNTFIWYLSLGVIYSSGAHFLLKKQLSKYKQI